VLVRLATTISQTPEYTVPIITDTLREVDFEPRVVDEFAVGRHGLWSIKVTDRRVGLDRI